MQVVILFSLLFSLSAVAGEIAGTAWEGEIHSWDNEVVTLKVVGRKIQVPRTEFGKYKLREKTFVRVEKGQVRVLAMAQNSHSIFIGK